LVASTSALTQDLKIVPIQSSIAFQVKPEIKRMGHTAHPEFRKRRNGRSLVARD
jgi:hypothetical protein